MTEIHEMSDAELMDFAETWLSTELRRIPTKLGLTPAQMMQVSFKCFGRVVQKYLDSIEEEDEQRRRSRPS